MEKNWNLLILGEWKKKLKHSENKKKEVINGITSELPLSAFQVNIIQSGVLQT